MIYSSLGAAGTFFEAWYSQNEKDRRRKEREGKSDGGGKCRDRGVLQIEWRKGTVPRHTFEKLALNPGLSFSTLHISPSCLNRVLPWGRDSHSVSKQHNKIERQEPFYSSFRWHDAAVCASLQDMQWCQERSCKRKENERERGEMKTSSIFFSSVKQLEDDRDCLGICCFP